MHKKQFAIKTILDIVKEINKISLEAYKQKSKKIQQTSSKYKKIWLYKTNQ